MWFATRAEYTITTWKAKPEEWCCCVTASCGLHSLKHFPLLSCSHAFITSHRKTAFDYNLLIIKSICISVHVIHFSNVTGNQEQMTLYSMYFFCGYPIRHQPVKSNSLYNLILHNIKIMNNMLQDLGFWLLHVLSCPTTAHHWLTIWPTKQAGKISLRYFQWIFLFTLALHVNAALLQILNYNDYTQRHSFGLTPFCSKTYLV